MAKPKPTYDELKTELDRLMLALQQEDLNVDQAVKHYERGLELVQALEQYLKTAENSIKELKAKFSGDK